MKYKLTVWIDGQWYADIPNLELHEAQKLQDSYMERFEDCVALYAPQK